MVIQPSEYLWSSYQANAMGKAIKCITRHPTYLSLGKTKASRLIAYRELIRGHLSDRDIHNIRQCLDHNYPMGNEKFKLEIEADLKTKLGHFK